MKKDIRKLLKSKLFQSFLDGIEISLSLSFEKADIIFNGKISCWNIDS